MGSRKDLEIARLVKPFDGASRTDGYVPFVFVTNVGEIVYQTNASNMGGPLTYSDEGMSIHLPDAPESVLEFELNSREFAYLSRIGVRKVPPLTSQPSATSAEPLIVPYCP